MARLQPTRTERGRPAKTRSGRTEDLFTGRYPPRPAGGPVENVDPRWLLKAAALAVCAALLCAYATLCLLVYQGQWQLVLHPVTSASPAGTAPGQPIRFGAGDTGQPQLAGVWLPAGDQTPTTPTVLYLADGSGNLAQDAGALEQLHGLPVNVFAFDYRGFGASAPLPHPNEARMTEDAETAFSYLVSTRHLAPESIVPYGTGLGASLAARLAQHHSVPAVVLESPQPDATAAALADSRARLVPLHLFFHERFELAGPLATLKAPKLLLESGPSHAPPSRGFSGLAAVAESPSMAVHLPAAGADPGRTDALWRASVLRFLDEYLPAAASGQRGTHSR